MKTLNKTQQGFTLVELIIVIVILGILAVTAAPKFLNIAGDARGGTLQAVLGSVTTANTLVNAKAKIQGIDETVGKQADRFVYEADDQVLLAYGYPVTSLVTAGTAPNNGLTAGQVATMWTNLLDLNPDDFVVAERRVNTTTNLLELAGEDTDGVPAIVIYPKDVALQTGTDVTTASNACYVYVTETTTAGDKPTAVAVTSGCSN